MFEIFGKASFIISDIDGMDCGSSDVVAILPTGLDKNNQAFFVLLQVRLRTEKIQQQKGKGSGGGGSSDEALK